jgi:hypothetical protein
MHRLLPVLLLAFTTHTAAATTLSNITRERVAGDVYHYSFDLRVGDSPNAVLRLHRVVRERAPWLPRPTSGGVMMMHGDFSTFPTNFAPTLGNPASPAPGLAPWLAARGIDVWGFDRRWTHPAPDGDVSDFADMGVAQELGDVRTALVAARALRIASASGGDRLTLIGFSHGAELAYLAASDDAKRVPAARNVKGLVPIDIYTNLSPADEDLRQFACANAAFDQELLGMGFYDSDNSFIIAAGSLAASDPDGASPLFDNRTNRQASLILAAKTWALGVAFTPVYHLMGGYVPPAGPPTGLRYTSETATNAWFAGAPFHESFPEAADFDAIMCGDAPLPVDYDPARIDVPLFYIGAAGGFGDHGLYTTTLVGSSDVSTLVVRRLPADDEIEDFGHADLLFADDAPDLVWSPLLSWLARH